MTQILFVAIRKYVQSSRNTILCLIEKTVHGYCRSDNFIHICSPIHRNITHILQKA